MEFLADNIPLKYNMLWIAVLTENMMRLVQCHFLGYIRHR